MTRPAASSSAPAPAPPGLALARPPGPVGVLLGAAGLCLAVITLAHPGATRMHAQPWSLAYINALLLPVLALLWRVFDPRRGLVLPATGWHRLAIGTAIVITVSAVLSPYRGAAMLWSAPLLAALAVFFLAVDWLHAEPAWVAERRERLRTGLFAFLGLVAVVSLFLWLRATGNAAPGERLAQRNLMPLGHPNYTAGLALLFLPVAVVMVRRRRGRWQITAAMGAVLALAMLFTSGSRGGLLGLSVLTLAGWISAPLSRRKKLQFAIVGVLAATVFAIAHPRTRDMFRPPMPGEPPNISNVQRQAMLVAGWRMGVDRPLLGWGPGTTPLAFPRYRAELEGGAENVLQLHSLPIQIWAELGAAGLCCLLVFAVQLVRGAAQDAPTALALTGYAVFSLTDWQLDVPVFAGAIALLSAFLVTPRRSPLAPRRRHAFGGLVVACLAMFAAFGRRDPAPILNSRALALARDATGTAEALDLFNQSLALNPDQEIAHFNLGWLLLISNPVAAEHHFLAAAHLVPDKGGVYFGLGLARLNQDRAASAAHALAMEALNDPSFITSPWWREPAIAAVRDPAAAELSGLVAAARTLLATDSWAAAQLSRVARRAEELGRVPPGPERSYRRERAGYPVLMRNLDLPRPVDLYDVREPASPPPSPQPVPPKGWLPAPILLALLDPPASRTN